MRFSLFIIILLCINTVYSFPFYEDFEVQDSIQLTATGDWEFGAPTIVGPDTAFEGTQIAGTKLSANYSSSTTSNLTTSTIALPDSTGITLQYHQWLQYQTCCDLARVSIQLGGIGSFLPLSGGSVYSTSSWVKQRVNLDAYANQNVKIRFEFTTNSSYVLSGWYIDSLSIQYATSFTLSPKSNGNGIMSPSSRQYYVDSTDLIAYPYDGYSFSHWAIDSGSAVLSDTLSDSTTIHLSSHTAISPQFVVAEMDTLSSDIDTLHATDDALDSNYSKGIWRTFIPDTTAYFRISLDHLEYSYFTLTYHNDTSFSASDKRIYGNTDTSYVFLAYSGTQYYFQVESTSSHRNKRVGLSIQQQNTLRSYKFGSGVTYPSQLYVGDNDTIPISAIPSLGYEFSHWIVSSGTATIIDSTSAITKVITETDAVLYATFIKRTFPLITPTPTVYDFTKDGLDSNATNGVYLKYNAPDSGEYVITVKEDSVPTNKTIMLFHDTTLTTYTTEHGFGDLRLKITADSAGQPFYIKVLPSTDAYTEQFSIFADTALTINFTHSNGGQVAPRGALSLSKGDSILIYTEPNLGYSFYSWSLLSGLGDVHSYFSDSTFVKPQTDMHMRIQFIRSPLISIQDTLTPYDLTENATNSNPDTGLLLKYTAPDSGLYIIAAYDDTLPTNKRFYQYDTSSFTSSIESDNGTGIRTLFFNADTIGSIGYFRLFTIDSLSAEQSVSIVSRKATVLTTSVIGNGTMTPSDSMYVGAQIPYDISADPDMGYSFDHWHTTSGSVTYGDSVAKNTTIQANNRSHISAQFIRTPCISLTNVSAIYNYTTHASDSSYEDGVFFEFIAPAPGTYNISVNNTGAASRKHIYLFSDSIYTSSYLINNSYSDDELVETYTATASGEKLYIRVKTSSSSSKNNNFIIRAARVHTLDVSAQTGGSVSAGALLIENGASTTITASPNKGHSFSHWRILSGQATIADSTSYSTTILMSSDAIVIGYFTTTEMHIANYIETDYNYTADASDGDNEKGVWFKYTAEGDGLQMIKVIGNDNTFQRIEFYGIDSTFSTYDFDSDYGTLQYTFMGVNLHTYYFRVYTSAINRLESFTLKADRAVSITLSTRGSGAAIIDESQYVFPGETTSIIATPSVGYHFSHWEKDEGFCLINNTSDASTTVTPITDIEITAHFELIEMEYLSSTPREINVTEHAPEGEGTTGVWFEFIPPSVGSYILTAQDAEPESTHKYITYYGTSIPGGQIAEIHGTGTQELTFSTAAPGTIHYFQITTAAHETDEDFFISINALTPGAILYSTSFEAVYTPIGTSTELLFTATGDWEIGAPGLSGPTTTQTGTQLAGLAIDSNYGNDLNDTLTSYSIQIPTNVHTSLVFYSWLFKENCCDYAYVEIKPSGQLTWTQISDLTESYTHWAEIDYNLTDYAGQTIDLRFRFTSDQNVIKDGWYLDDIKIVLSAIAPLTSPQPGDPLYNAGGGESSGTTGPISSSTGTGSGDPGTPSSQSGPSSSDGTGELLSSSSNEPLSSGTPIDPLNSSSSTLPLDTTPLIDSIALQDSLDSIAAPITQNITHTRSISLLPRGQSVIAIPASTTKIQIYSLDGSRVLSEIVDGYLNSSYIVPEYLSESRVHFIEFIK